MPVTIFTPMDPAVDLGFLLHKHPEKVQQGFPVSMGAPGLEALSRLVSGEPLWRVHDCVFGVLALEPEPAGP